MGNYVPVPLDVRAALDTAMPETDRAPGTLVTATDTHHRYWGPRRGTLAFTSAYEEDGSAMGVNYFTFAGVSDTAQTQGLYGQGCNLGTTWTLDLFWNLTDYTYAAGKDYIAVYEYTMASSNFYAIRVLIDNRVGHVGETVVKLVTTSSPGVTDGTITLTWAGGGTSNQRRHITVVRDGGTAVVYENGVQTASTQSLQVLHPHEDSTGGYARVGFCISRAASEAYFKGTIYAAVLRTSANLSNPVREETPPTYCYSDIRHYYLGVLAEHVGGAYDFLWDLSRYGDHALVSGATYGSNDQITPFFAPVQGFGTSITQDGKTMTLVLVGGQLYSKYTT